MFGKSRGSSRTEGLSGAGDRGADKGLEVVWRQASATETQWWMMVSSDYRL